MNDPHHVIGNDGAEQNSAYEPSDREAPRNPWGASRPLGAPLLKASPMGSLADACGRALKGLESTDARLCLDDAVHLGEQGSSWASLGIDGELSPAARLAVLLGVTAVRPSAFADAREVLSGLAELEPAELVDEAMLRAWTAAVVGAGRVDLAIDLLARCPYAPALPAVQTLARAGELEGARRLMQTIGWTRKHDRGLALVELALAGDGGLRDAFDAVMATERIETGPDRGGSELHALAAMAARLVESGAAPEPTWVDAMVRLGGEGQQRTRPTGFATLLAEAAIGVAERIGASTAAWITVVEPLRAAILFDDVAARVDGPLAEARARVDGGREVEVAEAAPELATPPDGWRTESDERFRLQDATLAMARALRDGDLVRYFDALAVGLDSDGPTDADRYDEWAAATGVDAERLLVRFVREHSIEPNRWCFRGPSEPWDAVAEVTDPACAEALLTALLDRDFVARAYGDWRRASSLSVPLAALLRRFPEREWLVRVLRSFAVTTHPKHDHRLYDLLVALGDHPALDPSLAEELPTDRRWPLWATVDREPRSLAELRAHFGEPADAFLHEVCARLAAAGRIDDALTLSEHERDRVTSRFDFEQNPPPTQASLMAIAQAGVPLSAEQKKAIIRRMKDAPRRRGDGHSKRLKELRALLKTLPEPASV